MGNCHDCSRKSATTEMLLKHEAKISKTTYRKKTRTAPNIDTLLNVLKICSRTIFNYAIAQHIYEVLIDEEYYVDDIVYDLDCYQSNIISLATQKITRNKLIKYQWNDNDCEIFYSLLLKIFKHKVTNTEALLDEFVYEASSLSLSTCAKDELISSVKLVVDTIDLHSDNASEQTCDSMDVQCVKQFFMEKNMNGEKLATMSMHTFVSLAKEYCISAAKARKLLHAFKQHSFRDPHVVTLQNGERSEKDVLNEHWNEDRVDIMNDKIAKKRALKLCTERDEISEDGADRGFITFLTHYLYTKNVNAIFEKGGPMDCISNTNDLMNALSISIILYKVKAFTIRNEDRDQKLRMDKSEILSIAKYIAIWITIHFGSNGMYFKMTKLDFKENIHLYFEEFVKINMKETQ